MNMAKNKKKIKKEAVDYEDCVVEIVNSKKKGYKISLQFLEKLMTRALELNKKAFMIIRIEKNEQEFFLITAKVDLNNKEH